MEINVEKITKELIEKLDEKENKERICFDVDVHPLDRKIYQFTAGVYYEDGTMSKILKYRTTNYKSYILYSSPNKADCKIIANEVYRAVKKHYENESNINIKIGRYY